MAGDIASYTVAVEELAPFVVPLVLETVEEYRTQQRIVAHIAVRAASCVSQLPHLGELDGVMGEALRCAQLCRAEHRAEVGIGVAKGLISIPFSAKIRKRIHAGVVAAASSCGIMHARMTSCDLPDGADTKKIEDEVGHVINYLRREPWNSEDVRFYTLGHIIVARLSKMKLTEEDSVAESNVLMH